MIVHISKITSLVVLLLKHLYVIGKVKYLQVSHLFIISKITSIVVLQIHECVGQYCRRMDGIARA